MLRRFLCLVGLAAVATPAAADVVSLRNGTTLEGIVRRTPGRVQILMESGTITVAEDLVAGISPRLSPLEIYRRRDAGIADGDIAARLRLATWCGEQGLPASARAQYERILADDPDHAGARRALGYRRHDGRWMTEDEIYRARGYVWSDGAWRSPAELAERAAARRRADQERLRVELATTRLRVEALEREAARERDASREDRRPVVLYGFSRRVPSRRIHPSCRFQGGLYPWWCTMPAAIPDKPHVCPRTPESSAWYRPPGPAWNPMPAWGSPR
jgi:hypothetical protein